MEPAEPHYVFVILSRAKDPRGRHAWRPTLGSFARLRMTEWF